MYGSDNNILFFAPVALWSTCSESEHTDFPLTPDKYHQRPSYPQRRYTLHNMTSKLGDSDNFHLDVVFPCCCSIVEAYFVYTISKELIVNLATEAPDFTTDECYLLCIIHAHVS